MPEGSPTIKTKPINGFGRLGKWLNGLLEDVEAIEPRGGAGITVVNGTSGSGKIIQVKTETYYVIRNGRVYNQKFVTVDVPTEVNT